MIDPLEVRQNLKCWCHKCFEKETGFSNFMWMVLCPTCGNKRCPKASSNPLEGRRMTEDFKAPDGTDLPGLPLLPLRLLPSGANVLGWWEEQFVAETVTPKWWQFWRKPTSFKRQVWVRRRLRISGDLADYLEGNTDRAAGLIWSLSERRPFPRLWNVTLERTPFSTSYICTSGRQADE